MTADEVFFVVMTMLIQFFLLVICFLRMRDQRKWIAEVRDDLWKGISQVKFNLSERIGATDVLVDEVRGYAYTKGGELSDLRNVIERHLGHPVVKTDDDPGLGFFTPLHERVDGLVRYLPGLDAQVERLRSHLGLVEVRIAKDERIELQKVKTHKERMDDAVEALAKAANQFGSTGTVMNKRKTRR